MSSYNTCRSDEQKEVKSIISKNITLSDLLDNSAIQKLFEEFHRVFPCSVAIVDVKGNILVSAGWQDVCTKLRRIDPEASDNCIMSDICLTKGLSLGEVTMYKYENYLYDVEIPIIVNNTRLGNIIIGQFVLDDEPIEIKLYKSQANQYNFDEKGYINTSKQVPRFNHNHAESIMSSCGKLASMIVAEGNKNIQLLPKQTEKSDFIDFLKKSKIIQCVILDNLLDIIMITDKEMTIKTVSPNIQRFSGLLPKDFYGQKVWNWIYPDDVSDNEKVVCELMKADHCKKTVECRCLTKDGSIKNIEATAVNHLNDPEINGILINFHDITQRIKRENKIKYLNYTDVLTGVYSRAFFEQKIKSYGSKCPLPFSVIMGDVNGLKLINDGFGHARGDKALIQIAKILKSCCRKDNLVYRTGGDEFCILLPQTDFKAVQAICERIYKACEKRNSSDDNVIKLSVSLGYAVKTDVDDTIESVFKKAEEFMYMHKLLEDKSSRSALITSIKTTMFEKSEETEEHAERMSILSKAVGMKMGLEALQINQLELLAVLHDVGKISVDQKILNKYGKLTEDEWMEIKKHPATGYRIVSATPELASIADGILCHHEHWDGSGYPQGLEREAIPLISRIIAVVDTYDVITNGRPYKKANSKEYALNEIKKNSGRQFDPKVVETFLSII